MKFDTSKTKGGCKILSLHGPDHRNCYAGVVDDDAYLIPMLWGPRGKDLDDEVIGDEYDLIPLTDEPKAEPEVTSEAFLFVTNKIHERLNDFDQRLAAEMKRNDELHKDAVARVNGLRADYLADQNAVQPSRLDALEERVEDAHETAAFANQKVVAWTDRVEALEIRLNKNDSEFVKLDQLTKETDRHLNTVGDLAQRACLQGVKLNQRLEALERIVQEQSDKRQPSDTKILEAAQTLVDAIANQVNTNLSWKDVNLNLLVPGYLLEGVRPLFNKSTQPSEKGVWVTTKTFWDVCWSEVDARGEPLEDLFERIAKRLGLED